MATALKKGESGGDTFKMYRNGTSLAAQWIRLCLPMPGVWIQSLVGELTSHISRGQISQLFNEIKV